MLCETHSSEHLREGKTPQVPPPGCVSHHDARNSVNSEE